MYRKGLVTLMYVRMHMDSLYLHMSKISKYVHTYVGMNWKFVCMCVYVYVRVCLYVCVRACVCACVCMHVGVLTSFAFHSYHEGVFQQLLQLYRIWIYHIQHNHHCVHM